MSLDALVERAVQRAVEAALADHRCACSATAPSGSPRVSYSVQETAERIGLHYQTVLAMTHSGEIPSRYFGRHIRTPADWVHEQAREPVGR